MSTPNTMPVTQTLDDSLASCISALHVSPAINSVPALQRSISQPTQHKQQYKHKLQPLNTQCINEYSSIELEHNHDARYRSTIDTNKHSKQQYSVTPTNRHTQCVKRSRPAHITIDAIDSNITANRPKSQKNIDQIHTEHECKMINTSHSTTPTTSSSTSSNSSMSQATSWPNTCHNKNQTNNNTNTNTIVQALIRQSSTPVTNKSYNTITSPYHTAARTPSMSPVQITSPHAVQSPHILSATSPIITRPSFAQRLSLNIPTTNERINTPKPLLDGCSTPLTGTIHYNNDTLHDGICYTEPYIAVSARKGGRRTMQDCFSCCPDIEHNQYIIVLADGHGSDGNSLSQIACQLLPACLSSAPSYNTSIENAFVETFQLIDSHMLQSNTATDGVNGGTTCSAVYIIHNTLYCAYVGDSRVVLCRDKHAIDLTTDHKPDNIAEKQRIESAGGNVVFVGNTWRVDSTLNISRSLGDPKLKHKQYITCIPDVIQYDIEKYDNLLIIATDGLWSAMTSQKAVDICLQLLVHNPVATPEQCSEALVEYALTQSALDNITCIVIFIHQLTQSLCHSNDNTESIDMIHTVDSSPIETEFYDFQLSEIGDSTLCDSNIDTDTTITSYVPPPIQRKKSTPYEIPQIPKPKHNHNISFTRTDDIDPYDNNDIVDRYSGNSTPALITPRHSQKSSILDTNLTN